MTTTPTSGAADLALRLRNACTSVRSKSYPLADLIPLMQQAADALASAPAQPDPLQEQAWMYEDDFAPQADSVQEDAARYRWLRRWKGQEHEPPFTVQHEIDGTLWGGDLDAAIDAARKQGEKQ